MRRERYTGLEYKSNTNKSRVGPGLYLLVYITLRVYCYNRVCNDSDVYESNYVQGARHSPPPCYSCKSYIVPVLKSTQLNQRY